MLTTIYKRFYVAAFFCEPPRKNLGLKKWRLCRDEEGIPRHWSSYGEAEEWVNSQPPEDGPYTIITKTVSYTHGDHMTILDIDALLVTTNI